LVSPALASYALSLKTLNRRKYSIRWIVTREVRSGAKRDVAAAKDFFEDDKKRRDGFANHYAGQLCSVSSRSARNDHRRFDLTDMHLKDISAPAVWMTVLPAR
jgi:hypothetical protein